MVKVSTHRYTQRPDRKGTESAFIIVETYYLNDWVTLKDPIERGVKVLTTRIFIEKTAKVTLKDPIEMGLKGK